MEYTEKKLHAIKFLSFIDIVFSAFFSLGILVGIIGALVSLFGGSSSFSLGEIVITGRSAAVPFLLFLPIASGFIGILLGIILFIPFSFFVKLRKGIKIEIIAE